MGNYWRWVLWSILHFKRLSSEALWIYTGWEQDRPFKRIMHLRGTDAIICSSLLVLICQNLSPFLFIHTLFFPSLSISLPHFFSSFFSRWSILWLIMTLSFHIFSNLINVCLNKFSLYISVSSLPNFKPFWFFHVICGDSFHAPFLNDFSVHKLSIQYPTLNSDTYSHYHPCSL